MYHLLNETPIFIYLILSFDTLELTKLGFLFKLWHYKNKTGMILMITK